MAPSGRPNLVSVACRLSSELSPIHRSRTVPACGDEAEARCPPAASRDGWHRPLAAMAAPVDLVVNLELQSAQWHAERRLIR